MIGVGCLLVISVLVLAFLSGLSKGLEEERVIGEIVRHVGLTALVVILIYSCYLAVMYVWGLWQPTFPKCKKQKCSQYVGYEALESVDNGYIFRCRCGDSYLVTTGTGLESTTRIMHLESSGEYQPYMKRTRFGRWVMDA